MRAFTDSAPVLEKAWAQQAGIGWRGKHSNVIRQGNVVRSSSSVRLILDLELAPDAPATDHCGTCRRCIDACPTEAITRLTGWTAVRCISYFTIELKDAIPPGAGDFRNWAFGCDICQQVCPWNRFSEPHNGKRTSGPKPELMATERRRSGTA
jgi:epoxyqueuosine reductase